MLKYSIKKKKNQLNWSKYKGYYFELLYTNYYYYYYYSKMP